MRSEHDKTMPGGLTQDDESSTAAHTALLVCHRDGLDVVPLDPFTPVVVGRAPPANLQLRSRRLSREHARFELRDGTVFLEDLGSTNGTWVNGVRLTGSVALGHDDEVVIGSVSVSVQALGSLQGRVEGLESHQRFRASIDEELARARAFQRGFALLMVREQGRRPLARWVPRVRKLLRLVDHVGLYSPDTVEVLLPESDRAGAERLAAAITRGNRPGELQLFVGIATVPGGGGSADELLDGVRAALGRATARAPIQSHSPVSISDAEPIDEPVVADAAMAAVYALVDRVAPSVVPVLLLGETGTGKELVARAIHERSGRAGQMRSINCGAIPRELVESELFGHERGAYTGADRQTIGMFESAQGSTVLLDEVGELAPGAQVALLRVLDTKRLRRVGGTEEIEVDVRVVAATHRDLDEMCRTGDFRWDLLYRLNAVSLEIPPLRERAAEIKPLVARFVAAANAANGRSVQGIAPDALELLHRYPWPGNVRELRNAIERAVVIAMGSRVEVDDLPERVRTWSDAGSSEPPANAVDAVTEELTVLEDLDLKRRVQAFEEQQLRSALRSTGGNRTAAAELLGMPRRTLLYKLRTYAIGPIGEGQPPLEAVLGADGRTLSFQERVQLLEAHLMAVALQRAGGDRNRAARLLGVQKRTLDHKLDRDAG